MGKRAAPVKQEDAYTELTPAAALVDNINDDFSAAVTEAIELVLGQEEFQDIQNAAPLGIALGAGVQESQAGSKAGS